MSIFSKSLYKSKIAKQFVYNWLQLAKILSKFYRKELRAAEKDATMSFQWLWAGYWYMHYQTKKYDINEHEQAQSWPWRS